MIPLSVPDEYMTPEKERKLIIKCANTANPDKHLIVYVRGLCSPTNLFIPNCASFLREWLEVITFGASCPVPSVLQKIYEYRLFMLCGGHLLLSGHKPTNEDLYLLQTMATDPYINEGRRNLLYAFISVHREDTLVDPPVLTVLFILQDMMRNGVIGGLECVLVDGGKGTFGVLNEIMTMFIAGCITLYELHEYMMILYMSNSTPLSLFNSTYAITKLLMGLYDDYASPTEMSDIIEMLKIQIEEGTLGTNHQGILLALHIVPMLPVQNDDLLSVQRTVQPEDAATLAVLHSQRCLWPDQFGTFLKVSCDRTCCEHKELFKKISTSYMKNVFEQYADAVITNRYRHL